MAYRRCSTNRLGIVLAGASLWLSLIFWTGRGDAQTEVRDLRPLLQPILERHDLPAMAAATVRGWDVVGSGAVGVRRRGSPTCVTIEDRFHLGSCTKSMTATVAAMLVERGLLKWTKTLAESFPEFEPAMSPAYRNATVEQLLTNCSGTPAGFRENHWLSLSFVKAMPAEHRSLLAQYVLTDEPQAAPRGHTSDGNPIEPGPQADLAVALRPAGLVHCSVVDWAKYVALHLRGHQGDARLLRAQSFAKLHAQGAGPEAEYAMGWHVKQDEMVGGTVFYHTGTNGLWMTLACFIPQLDFAVVVACNQAGQNALTACSEAAGAMIQERLRPTAAMERRRVVEIFGLDPLGELRVWR